MLQNAGQLQTKPHGVIEEISGIKRSANDTIFA